MAEKRATVEFENSDPQVEEVSTISTDINPQEINQDPAEYARQVAAQRGSEYDQMAGFSVPRDFVILPSKGRIYPSDSPLHNMEEIEVRHLTAADEDILTSRSLLRSGAAIDTLLDNVIINKNIKAEELISGDKNAIMTFLRITGYGPEYNVEISCPDCNEDVKSEFDLSQLNMKMLDTDPIADGQNRFSFVLPSGVDVHFKFLTSKEEKIISDEQDKLKKMTNSPLDHNVTTRLKYQLISVDGNEDKSYINKFINVMNVRDSRAFRKYFEEIEPDVIMKQDFNCPQCGHRGEVDIPVTVDFFWPDD